MRYARRERGRWQRESLAVERQRWELARKQHGKATWLKNREKEVAAWAGTYRIQDFIQAVKEKAVRRRGKVAPASELGKWIAWALEQADRFDPLR